MKDTEKKLNVLMMVSWYGPRGDKPTGGIFHYEQAVELNKYCNCAIYCPYDRLIDNPVECHEDWGIVTYRSKYKLEKKLRNRWYMFLAMRKIVKEFKPDIIHGNVATEAGRFAVVLGKLFNIPVMITEHSAAEYSGVYTFPHHLYAKFAYKYSKYNACVSDHLTDALSTLFPKYKFHTIYNGIIAPQIDCLKTGFRIVNKVNFSIVAGLYDDKIKGLQYLLPAVSRLKKERFDIAVHIIGGGEYLDYYINVAKQLKIDDCVIFHGELDKNGVYSIVAEMDFDVSASIVESFGCSLAEAALLGKPLLATKCGGPESIVNDINGLLVEPESEEALYEGIKKMIGTYQQYDAEKIREDAINRFEIGKITEKYLEVYKQVLRII